MHAKGFNGSIPHVPSAAWFIAVGIVCIILTYLPLHQWWSQASMPNWLYKFVSLYIDPFVGMPWGLLFTGIAFMVIGSFFTVAEIRESKRIESYPEFLKP